MNTPTKQTVYRPSNVEDGSKYRIFDLHECEGDFIQNVTEGYGYFFTPEQLNEYTQGVIKQALETAAENAERDECSNLQKKRYSEEEVITLLQKYRYDLSSGKTPNIGDTTKIWFELNKNDIFNFDNIK